MRISPTGREALADRQSQHRARGNAENGLGLPIPFEHRQRAIHSDHGIERRGDELPQPRFRFVQRLLSARARERFADDVRRGAQKGQLIVGECSLVAGIGQDHAERSVLRADGHARAAAHSVIGAQVRGLESGLFVEFAERERSVGHQRDHAQRIVLVGIARAAKKCIVRAEGRTRHHPSAGRDLQRAAMRHLQRELHQRASLPEENEGIDPCQRRLTQLGDGDLLPIPRLQLRAQQRQLHRARVGAPFAVLHEMEQRLFRHLRITRSGDSRKVYVGRAGKRESTSRPVVFVLTTIHTTISITICRQHVVSPPISQRIFSTPQWKRREEESRKRLSKD